MTTQHTPAPWFYGQDTIFNGNGDAASKVICETNVSIKYSPSRYVSIEEDKANARLIAAAPDMLEFTKQATQWFNEQANRDVGGFEWTIIQMGLAAIKKATGV